MTTEDQSSSDNESNHSEEEKAPESKQTGDDEEPTETVTFKDLVSKTALKFHKYNVS